MLSAMENRTTDPDHVLEISMSASSQEQNFLPKLTEHICRIRKLRCHVEVLYWEPSLTAAFVRPGNPYAIGVATFGPNPDDFKRAEISYSFEERRMGIVIPESDLLADESLDELLKAVASTETWIVCLAVFALNGLLWIVRDPKACKDWWTFVRRSWKIVFTLCAVFLNQDDLARRWPESPTAATLSITWIWWVAIISALVNSLLPSQLIVQMRSLPFNDPASLVDANYSLAGISLAHRLLRESSDELGKTLAARMLVLPRTAPTEQMFEEKASGPRAVLLEQLTHNGHPEQSHHQKCRPMVTAIPGVVGYSVSNFIFRKKSAYRKMFEQEELRLFEYGLLSHFKTDSYFSSLVRKANPVPRCVPKPFVKRFITSPEPTDWAKMVFVYRIFGGMLGCCTLVLVLELLSLSYLQHLPRRTSRKRWSH